MKIASHSLKLYPTKSQERLLKQSCGVARFAYNWALVEWKNRYESGEKPTAFSLVKYLNSIKKEQFPWMQETLVEISDSPSVKQKINGLLTLKHL